MVINVRETELIIFLKPGDTLPENNNFRTCSYKTVHFLSFHFEENQNRGM